MDDNFNWKHYLNNYKDLRDNKINTKEKAEQHWKLYGKQEGRIHKHLVNNVNSFDWIMYINNYEDLQIAKINTKEKAVQHWEMYGKKEGRTCEDLTKKIYVSENEHYNIFDWVEYKKKKQHNFLNKMHAWKYWLSYGKRCGDIFCKIQDGKVVNNEVENIDDGIKFNIAVLSANFGNYDMPASDLKNIKNYSLFDWYYITDITDSIKSTDVWKFTNLFNHHLYYIPKIHNNDKSRMYSKFYKMQMLNIDIFKKYDYVIWLDASVILQNTNFVENICSLLKNNKKHIFFIYNHAERSNILQEVYASLPINKYTGQDLKKQAEYYYANGYNNNCGLYETGIFIIKNCSQIKKIMDEWWQENQNFSYQCQISLPYVLNKNNVIPFLLNDPVYIKGRVMGIGSVWNNQLFGKVRKHLLN